MSEPLQTIDAPAPGAAKSDQTEGAQDLDLGQVLGEKATLDSVPFAVHVRFEEDVAQAYRDWYKEQVSKDKRDELGRFLFGVSSASLGLLAGLQRVLPPNPTRVPRAPYLLFVSAALFLLSAVCALYLAVPKNRQIRPDEIELVSLQRKNAKEMTTVAILWFGLWMLGIATGGFQLTL